jgi:hypothetical protein
LLSDDRQNEDQRKRKEYDGRRLRRRASRVLGPAPLSDWAPASWTSQQRTDALTTAWRLLSRGGRRLHRAVHERPGWVYSRHANDCRWSTSHGPCTPSRPYYRHQQPHKLLGPGGCCCLGCLCYFAHPSVCCTATWVVAPSNCASFSSFLSRRSKPLCRRDADCCRRQVTIVVLTCRRPFVSVFFRLRVVLSPLRVVLSPLRVVLSPLRVVLSPLPPPSLAVGAIAQPP